MSGSRPVQIQPLPFQLFLVFVMWQKEKKMQWKKFFWHFHNFLKTNRSFFHFNSVPLSSMHSTTIPSLVILDTNIHTGLRSIIFLILLWIRMFCVHVTYKITFEGIDCQDLEQFPLSANRTTAAKSTFLGGRAGITNIHLSEEIIRWVSDFCGECACGAAEGSLSLKKKEKKCIPE